GPLNWTGFYVGGQLGAGHSFARWSDPFPSTANLFGGFFFLGTNAAGFGDTTAAGGLIAGGQLGANWEIGHLVLGIELDADGADMRGENTCCSGLGGVNCQHIVNGLETLTGRVGFAWDRSLVYAKGGSGAAETTYRLLGNTNGGFLALGAG